jgi:hypothetical protein
MEQILTDEQFLRELATLVGGAKGAGGLVLALFGVKVLTLAFNWRLGNLVGMWKLVIISGLTLAGGVVSQLVNGMPVSGAILNAATITAASVFLNQLYKQFQKIPEDRSRIAPPIK